MFSSLSAASANNFPDELPLSGYAENPFGFYAVAHASQQNWLDQMLDIISQDIPVIVLQKYLLILWNNFSLLRFSLTDGDGHFRIVVGYDESSVTTLDPWDRNGQPRKFTVSRRCFLVSLSPFLTISEFSSLWNYTETYPFPRNPYYALVVLPLVPRVAKVSSNSLVVSVSPPIDFKLFEDHPVISSACLSLVMKNSTSVPSMCADSGLPISYRFDGVAQAPQVLSLTVKATYSFSSIDERGKVFENKVDDAIHYSKIMM